MLKRPDIAFTPMQQAILAQMHRRAARQWAYANIGKQIPGVPRRPPGGYVWVPTGKQVELVHHKLVVRNGKPVREPYIVMSPVMTLLDVRTPKAHRMAYRKSRFLPEHP